MLARRPASRSLPRSSLRARSAASTSSGCAAANATARWRRSGPSRSSTTSEASAVAAEATALASDVVLDRDGPDLRHRAVAFAAAHPDDVDAADLARRLERGNDRLAGLRASIAGARAVEDRYAGDASRAAGSARAASLMLIALALGLAVLLLWCVWARRSAARAAKQEQRFRSIVRNSSDLILVVGGRGNVIDCTPVVEKMLGRSVACVVGSDFAALVHADDESPLTTPGPWRARHADGSWIDVESTC